MSDSVQRETPCDHGVTGAIGNHVFTLGHSTRTREEFTRLVKSHGIECIADVRTFTSSRRSPRFDRTSMHSWLWEADVFYFIFPSLGGKRRVTVPRKESRNSAWLNESFRNYADHALTDEFDEGLEMLKSLAGMLPTAIMCAETVPWKCHRSLISDNLVAQGWEVEHVMGDNTSRLHVLGGWGAAPVIVDGRVTYPVDR